VKTPGERGASSMSDPKDNDQWHGISRQEIEWHPTIIAE